MRGLATIGIASGLAGSHPGCWRGPFALRDSPLFYQACKRRELWLDWCDILQPGERACRDAAVADLCRRAGRYACALVRQSRPFLFVGGDHSNAMGIWRGALAGLPHGRTLGLLWIDAHMDAHTFISSPSGNIHGMPVAALLGQGDRRLAHIAGAQPVLTPQQLVLLGVRSFEPEEQRLLARLGVTVIQMAALDSLRRLALLLGRLLDRLLRKVDYFGVSIDLDAIDPRDAPAVATPEPGGIRGDWLCAALGVLRDHPRCLGLEIAEYDPRFDHNQCTLRLIADLVGSVYGGLSSPNRSFGFSRSGTRSSA